MYIYINKRLNHSKWQFESYGQDHCTVTLLTGQGDESTVKLHNLYNPDQTAENRQSVLSRLQRVLDAAGQAEQIVMGDFNLHHELWGGSHVARIKPEAEDLVEMLEEYNLTSMLAPGSITYEEGQKQSTIDLCLVTPGMVDRVIRCKVDRGLNHDSDHLPIVTIVNTSVKPLHREPRRNWKAMDAQRFKATLLDSLPPPHMPRTRNALDRYVEDIVAALQEAVEAAVPLRTWSSAARRGWDKECKQALAEAKRLQRAYTAHHTDEAWEAYRAARNHKGRVIKKALRNAHRESVERASESPEAL